MADPIRHSNAAVRRRHQVEAQLSAYGLASTSHWWGKQSQTPASTVQHVLEDLGGLFAAFGRYLATRADLLPLTACLQLTELAEHRPPTPLDKIQQLVLTEFGTDLEKVYTTFDPIPYRLDLFSQAHHAQLHDDRPVVVQLFHPDLEEVLNCDLVLLPVLTEVLHGPPWQELKVALEDFRQNLSRQLDFRLQAQNLHRLTQDTQNFDLLEVPLAYMDFSTAHVLTVERLPGHALETVIANPNLTDLASIPPADLARNLCLGWLRQALEGSLYPVDTSPANTTVLSGNRLAFNGTFASLEADTQENLRQYLIAAAAQDPDKACNFLLREMYPITAKGQHQLSELQQNFRQIVPFRDGSWSRSGASDSLGEHLFVHWRLVRQFGFVPKPHMVLFFRGLFSLVFCARQIDPEQDALRQGLEDWRLTASLNRFREMISPGQIEDSADKYTNAALAVPQQLEQLLEQLNEDRLTVKVLPADASQKSNQPNVRVIFWGLSTLSLGLILWLDYIETIIDSIWVERLGALLFVLLGALLLRTIWRLR